MSLEDLGNIGEFVAAVGVIISLIYLAIQIRQNAEALRSAMQQAWAHHGHGCGVVDGWFSGRHSAT
jgi:hypothetical protein